MIINPFTGQVLINANPKGCNQYSGPECTAYHGTRKDFDKFKNSPRSRTGHWFNDDESVIDKTYGVVDESYGSHLKPPPKILKAKLKLGKRVPEKDFRRLVEYFAALDKNPEDYEGEEEEGVDLDRWLRPTYDGMYKAEEGETEDLEWGQMKALRSFRKAGYHSASIKSPFGGTDHVVADPKRIKIVSKREK